MEGSFTSGEKISYNFKKTLKLLFDKDQNLEEKILNEQFIL